MTALEEILFLLRISRSRGIVRRYFVTNGFDGALAMLGLIMGFYVSGGVPLGVAISVCLSTAIALAVSGLSSAYISEMAERRRELHQLERAMVADLGGSAYGRATRLVPLIIALVNGLAPLCIALVIVAPPGACAPGRIAAAGAAGGLDRGRSGRNLPVGRVSEQGGSWLLAVVRVARHRHCAVYRVTDPGYQPVNEKVPDLSFASSFSFGAVGVTLSQRKTRVDLRSQDQSCAGEFRREFASGADAVSRPNMTELTNSRCRVRPSSRRNVSTAGPPWSSSVAT